MKRSHLIYIAAGLALLTGVGQIISTFTPTVPDLLGTSAAIEQLQILIGAAVLLLLCGFQLIAIAKRPSSQPTNQRIGVAAFWLAGSAVISATNSLLIPAVFTGIAAILCLIARTRPSEILK